MPIVNNLSYNMKSSDELIDDVKLVGFARSGEASRESIAERLGNGCSPRFWKRCSGERSDGDGGGDERERRERTTVDSKNAESGHCNGAFLMNESENCVYCTHQTHDPALPSHLINHSHGTLNERYILPPPDRSDSGSSNGSSWAEDTVRKCCSKTTLYKRLPILDVVKNYQRDMIVSDMVAGITVGLTMVPQAIAYANVAGLPSEYGLYSAYLGCFIYVILGTCRQSSIGPSAISAILIRESIHSMGPPFAILLCFLTGAVQLIMGLLQLGFLVDFISGPVSAGFTSAAAIVIAMTQVKDLLGLNINAQTFLGVWDQITTNCCASINFGDASLGITCMIILFVLRKIKDVQIGPEDLKEKTTTQKVLGEVLWFLSTARNILVVTICSSIVFVYKEYLGRNPPFKLLDSIKPGLRDFQLPPFSATVNNATYDFFGMTSIFGSGIVVVPLLSLLENVSGAKVFSNGKSIDATQELIALGTCNLFSSFVGSMSVSGGLSRAAISNASGVRSTVHSIYTGSIVILSLLFFTPLFKYIPRATLAAVIVAAVIFMVEVQVVKPIWRTKKLDLIPAICTFLCSLLIRLELGILVGVSINVLFLLYGSARPSMQVDKFKSEWGYEYIVITPDRSLAFPSVEYVRNVVSKAGLKQGYSSIPVVIDSRHVQGADFTAAKGIKSLIEDFVKRNQLLLFYNLKSSVIEIFQGVNPKEFHHVQTEHELHQFLKDYYFRTSNNANSVVPIKK